MQSWDFTYVAPATNISIVRAFVKPDKIAMKRIVATIMTIIRDVILLIALQRITGANRKIMMIEAMSVRVARVMNEPEDMYTFGSLEIS